MKQNQKDDLINQINEEIPQVDIEDITGLINNVISVYSVKRKDIDRSLSLNSWVPNKQTVKEILKLKVNVRKDLEYCITDFVQFAKSKEWNITDNLDAKFIGHVKLMILNKKIRLEFEE